MSTSKTLVVLALTLALSGCTAAPVAITNPAPTETAVVSPTEAADAADGDPADFPILNGRADTAGVAFTLAGGALQCAILDPVVDDGRGAAPFFGCVVTAESFPYPPLEDGPLDSANAFVSSSHEGGRATSVTDSTLVADTADQALLAGETLTWTTVTCAAASDVEVRCTDETSGHGIEVSTTTYALF